MTPEELNAMSDPRKPPCKCGYPDIPGQCPGPANCPMAQEDAEIPQIVNEAIDNYGRYYAEHHNMGMGVRDDMRYIAELMMRWFRK